MDYTNNISNTFIMYISLTLSQYMIHKLFIINNYNINNNNDNNNID